MWKHKPKAEWLPWYRARNYKGDLTEAEKRQLDAFRMQPKHPAAWFEDLPEEVQDYISKITLELYDRKQDGAAGRATFFSAVGAGLLFLNYKGCLGAPTIGSNVGGVLFLVLPRFFYWCQWKENAEEFLPSDAPWRATEEGIRQEWKLNYLGHSRRAERASSNGS